MASPRLHGTPKFFPHFCSECPRDFERYHEIWNVHQVSRQFVYREDFESCTSRVLNNLRQLQATRDSTFFSSLRILFPNQKHPQIASHWTSIKKLPLHCLILRASYPSPCSETTLHDPFVLPGNPVHAFHSHLKHSQSDGQCGRKSWLPQPGLMCQVSKGRVGYPWESTRDIYQQIPPTVYIVYIYNGCIGQYGVIIWELFFSASGVQPFMTPNKLLPTARWFFPAVTQWTIPYLEVTNKQPFKGSPTTIPKRSQRIARYIRCIWVWLSERILPTIFPILNTTQSMSPDVSSMLKKPEFSYTPTPTQTSFHWVSRDHQDEGGEGENVTSKGDAKDKSLRTFATLAMKNLMISKQQTIHHDFGSHVLESFTYVSRWFHLLFASISTTCSNFLSSGILHKMP